MIERIRAEASTIRLAAMIKKSAGALDDISVVMMDETCAITNIVNGFYIKTTALDEATVGPVIEAQERELDHARSFLYGVI